MQLNKHYLFPVQFNSDVYTVSQSNLNVNTYDFITYTEFYNDIYENR